MSLFKNKYGLAGFGGLAGGLIGGIGGLVRGDNYSDTAALRNFTGGALGGIGIGVGGLFGAMKGGSALLRGGIKGTTNRFIGSAKQAGRFGLKRLGVMGKVGNAFSRHPGAFVAGGAVLGGGLYANSAMNTGPGLDDRNIVGLESDAALRSFQNSASGITFGLHAKRHR